jgi:molybdate transport system substrate-binding protein
MFGETYGKLMSVFRLAFAGLLLCLPVQAGEVTVFAAASLKTALDEIGTAWEAQTGNGAVLSYGGSSALARQIIAGAPADVFISAAPEWMDAVADAGLIVPDSRVDLLGNRLVLVAHGAGVPPITLDASTDLAGMLDGGRLSMAMVDAVPAGQYGREALVSLGLWDSVKDTVAQSENVRVALQLVALGEAPLGIVYASDARADAAEVSVLATFPEESHRPIIYPAAVIASGATREATAFLDYLQSPAAQAVFEAQGFAVLAGQ